MSGAEQALVALKSVELLLLRFYESPSLAHTRTLAVIDAELPGLRAAIQALEAESKRTALANAQAALQTAIGHLQEVLNKPRTHEAQQRADKAAREWLESIGSEPT